MTLEPVMTHEEVQAYTLEVFPESAMYGWKVEEVSGGRIAMSMQTSQEHLRPGGTVSGPTMFALADVTAYVLILAHIGKVALAVTTNLNINFLRKPEPGALRSTGRLVKLGKRLAVCEVHIYSGSSDDMVAQATATYSIPPR